MMTNERYLELYCDKTKFKGMVNIRLDFNEEGIEITQNGEFHLDYVLLNKLNYLISEFDKKNVFIELKLLIFKDEVLEAKPFFESNLSKEEFKYCEFMIKKLFNTLRGK